MKGSRIEVASKGGRGVYEEVIVVGTPVPGIVMEIVPGTDPVGGVFSYAPYGTAGHDTGQGIENDGDRKAIAILLENDAEGKIFSDAYTTGTRGRVYYPAMGEQFNMRIGNISGTGDDYVIGTELMVSNDDTEADLGELMVADNDAQAHPFTILEANTDVTVDFYAHVRFNGEGGA